MPLDFATSVDMLPMGKSSLSKKRASNQDIAVRANDDLPASSLTLSQILFLIGFNNVTASAHYYPMKVHQE